MKEILAEVIMSHPFIKNKEELVSKMEAFIGELEEDSWKLNCLEGAGVDNWSGYDYAMELMREDEE